MTIFKKFVFGECVPGVKEVVFFIKNGYFKNGIDIVRGYYHHNSKHDYDVVFVDKSYGVDTIELDLQDEIYWAYSDEYDSWLKETITNEIKK